MAAIETKVAQTAEAHEKWSALKGQLDVKQHALGVLQKCLQQTTHYKLQEEVENLTQEIGISFSNIKNQFTYIFIVVLVNLKQKVHDAEETEQKNTRKVAELEEKAKDTKGHKEKQLTAVQAETESLRKKAEKSKENWRKHEQEYDLLVTEIEELKKEIELIKKDIEGMEENMAKLREEQEGAKKEADANKVRVV